MGTNVKYWGSNFWGDSMLIQGNNNTLMFTNVETNVSWSDAIRITGNNNVFYGVNLYMKRWDMANWGFPWLGDYGTGNDIQTMFVRLEP